MAWSWSHSTEAYLDAYENLLDKSPEFIREAWAEIQADVGNGGFDKIAFDKAMFDANNTPVDILARAVWDWAEEERTCDNGGFGAWVCPYGCHTVSFTRETD